MTLSSELIYFEKFVSASNCSTSMVLWVPTNWKQQFFDYIIWLSCFIKVMFWSCIDDQKLRKIWCWWLIIKVSIKMLLNITGVICSTTTRVSDSNFLRVEHLSYTYSVFLMCLNDWFWKGYIKLNVLSDTTSRGKIRHNTTLYYLFVNLWIWIEKLKYS